MISQIRGKIKQRLSDSVLLEVNGISYEVFIPHAIMDIINSDTELKELELITYHYNQIDHSKSIPVLIGFTNEVEREFFEKFITVSGIGPRAALKALSKPISEIAKAIDDMDYSLLNSLPGIGMQRAKEIVAKLQGKVGKFALIQDSCSKEKRASYEDIKNEAIQILLKLQYNPKEAQDMVDKALKRKSGMKTPEEVLNEVYKQRSE